MLFSPTSVGPELELEPRNYPSTGTRCLQKPTANQPVLSSYTPRYQLPYRLACSADYTPAHVTGLGCQASASDVHFPGVDHGPGDLVERTVELQMAELEHSREKLPFLALHLQLLPRERLLLPQLCHRGGYTEIASVLCPEIIEL